MRLQKRLNYSGNEKKINKILLKLLKTREDISVHGDFKYKGVIFTRRKNDSIMLDSEFKIADSIRETLPWYKKLYISEKRMKNYVTQHRDKNIFKACGRVNRKNLNTFWIEIRSIDNSTRSMSKFFEVDGCKEYNRKGVIEYVQRTIESITADNA